MVTIDSGTSVCGVAGGLSITVLRLTVPRDRPLANQSMRLPAIGLLDLQQAVGSRYQRRFHGFERFMRCPWRLGADGHGSRVTWWAGAVMGRVAPGPTQVATSQTP